MSMDTNDLIAVLSQSAPPRKPVSFTLVLFILCVASAAVTVIFLGVRADLGEALPHPGFLFKTLLLFTAAMLAGLAVRRGATPLSRLHGLTPFVWGFALLLGGAILFEWVTTPATQILALFPTPNFIICLLAVLIYGSIGVVCLIGLMRLYAPADPKTAATLIGLAAATTGALGYSLHCPFDSPTFIVVAYSLPILGVTMLARCVAPTFIRW